jgi:hypothetical protein
MSMGYGANYADTVSDKFVKKIVGAKLFNCLQSLLKEDTNDGDLDMLNFYDASDKKFLVTEGFTEAFIKCYEQICTVFRNKTKLSLQLIYHDAKDRDDEVDGLFWVVDGVYQLTKAGKKHQKEIKRAFYVTFG